MIPDNSVARIIVEIIVALPAFLLAIILHEVAHGYVAYLCGDDTAKRAGRLTLSPLPHIDPMGAIFFVVSRIAGMGFGWAKPVPVAVQFLRNPRRDEVLVTLAGPAANFLQLAAWAVLTRLSLQFLSGDLRATLAQFCFIGVQINALLMVFNLLPIPPLDGSHVAARVLGVEDPYLIDRLAPVGFVLLFLLISTGVFDVIYQVAVIPLIHLFLS